MSIGTFIMYVTQGRDVITYTYYSVGVFENRNANVTIRDEGQLSDH